ncbi:Uncharacterised protein [Salmonella enterica subsp. enterica serovar Bovismorbificans]|uniref:Uncharacterized protein n=1 Tax=Salmonella enterica subsp. enterica serovar Bovismorbificans TaxID=58097 RepID=A0A655DIF7_SALET|nr:Uncharacterised protein [Salmonella enterica subsp. enterica serovar Bovismorbificans]
MIVRIANIVFKGDKWRAFEQMLTGLLQRGEIRQIFVRHRQARLFPDVFNPRFLIAPLAKFVFNA